MHIGDPQEIVRDTTREAAPVVLTQKWVATEQAKQPAALSQAPAATSLERGPPPPSGSRARTSTCRLGGCSAPRGLLLSRARLDHEARRSPRESWASRPG